MYRIELQVGDQGGGTPFSAGLSPGADCVLGRAQTCTIVVDDTMAADRHCRLFLDAGRVMVENLDQEIGTCLNGEFVADPMPVRDGSELLVGTTVLVVSIHPGQTGEPVSEAPPVESKSAETAGLDETATSEPLKPEPSPMQDASSTASATQEAASWGVHPFEPPGARTSAADEDAVTPTPEPAGREPVRPGPSQPEPARPAEPEPLAPYQPPGQKAEPGERSEAGVSGAGATRSWAHAMTYSADADLMTRIDADLRQEFADRVGSRDRETLRALVKRGIERAHGYGLEQEDHIFQFLRCMVMLDDEIDGRNPDTEDVWLTLNHARRPAAQRIERAVKIASRIAGERSGSRSKAGSVMRPPSRPAARPAAPEAPAAAAGTQSPAAVSSPDEETAAGDVSAGTHATRGTPPPPPDSGAAEAMPEIEGFLIKEEIGAGGMGRVFLAYDNQLDKDVAIKVLRTVDPEAQEQLQHEARAAARLEHPNIVQVSRFEKLGRGGYYVMQFVRGLDGSKLVKKFESAGAHQLPGEQVLKAAGVDAKRSPAELRELLVPDKNAYYRLVAYWMAGVADGLERAHTEGVLHRDIKPSNLLLSGDGRMMVTDFGLAARPADRQGVGRARVGTPRYLSPERVADWASFSDEVQHRDARADVWSLGAVLYEFLTYRPAFKGSIPEVLRAIVTEAPAPPNSLVWSVPEGLQRICLMAMARRPDDRFLKSGDMAESLRGWIRVETGIEKKGRIPFLT